MTFRIKRVKVVFKKGKKAKTFKFADILTDNNDLMVRARVWSDRSMYTPHICENRYCQPSSDDKL
jgi:hypothetical protein